MLSYTKDMFFHNIIHSSEERVIRQLVINQKGIKEETWYTGVEKWLSVLQIEREEEKIKEIKKSTWKKLVKDGLQKVIEREVLQKASESTKMQFVKNFQKQEYIGKCNMATVKEIMKIRLNMVEVGENFRGKVTGAVLDGASWCLACGCEKETTEHVINCSKYRELTGHTVVTSENCFENTAWLINATKAYQTIEETREILISSCKKVVGPSVGSNAILST